MSVNISADTNDNDGITQIVITLSGACAVVSYNENFAVIDCVSSIGIAPKSGRYLTARDAFRAAHRYVRNVRRAISPAAMAAIAPRGWAQADA